MKMSDIPFGITDWSAVEATEHPGDTGMAYWRTRQFGDVLANACLARGITALGRWKMVDNLRRSLVTPSWVAASIE